MSEFSFPPLSHMTRFFAASRALFASAVVLFPFLLRGQAAAPVAAPKAVEQIVSVSPINLIFGLYGAEYEKKIDARNSWGASAGYFTLGGFSYLNSELKYRYYPQEKALEGFGVGLTTGLTRIAVDDNTSSQESTTALSVGFALDYQWLLGSRKNFAITLGSGARRLVVVGRKLADANLILPTFRLAIGRGF